MITFILSKGAVIVLDNAPDTALDIKVIINEVSPIKGYLSLAS